MIRASMLFARTLGLGVREHRRRVRQTRLYTPSSPNRPRRRCDVPPNRHISTQRKGPHGVVKHHPTPKLIFLECLGLAIFQVLKAGFVFSGKAGSGIVIARLPDGSWSAPSCIATGGLGWGLQIGADITDFVVVLNSEDGAGSVPRARWRTALGIALSADSGLSGSAVRSRCLSVHHDINICRVGPRTDKRLQDLRSLLSLSRQRKRLRKLPQPACDLVAAVLEKCRCLNSGFLCAFAESVEC